MSKMTIIHGKRKRPNSRKKNNNSYDFALKSKQMNEWNQQNEKTAKKKEKVNRNKQKKEPKGS